MRKTKNTKVSLLSFADFIVGDINRFDGIRNGLLTTQELLHSCGKRCDYEPVAPQHHSVIEEDQ